MEYHSSDKFCYLHSRSHHLCHLVVINAHLLQLQNYGNDRMCHISDSPVGIYRKCMCHCWYIILYQLRSGEMCTSRQSQLKSIHIIFFIQASKDRKYKARTSVRDLPAQPIKEEINRTKRFRPDSIANFEVSIL